jgi:hypothetical protein
MSELKTGAIICKKHRGEHLVEYEALLFITNIPHELKDRQLENIIDIRRLNIDLSQCPELIYRADIQSTSNEVQEQFENFHKSKKPIPAINFGDIRLRLVL